MESINPVYREVGSLIGGDCNFLIPKYQRSYAWGCEQIEDFFSDIEACFQNRRRNSIKKHFFGSIVAVEGQIDGYTEKEYEIIDGQQRIATFIMFAACLIEKYREISRDDELVRDLNKQFIKYRYRSGRRTKEGYKIKLSKADNNFFEMQIMEAQDAEAERDSHEKIKYAYSYLKQKIDELLEGENNENQLDILDTLNKVLNSDCAILFLITRSLNDAYRLFQVINDRGIGLTEGDLLRAKTLEVLEGEDSLQNRVEDAWNKILDDPPAVTKKYLECYYASKIGSKTKSSQLYDQFLSALFNEAESDPNSEAKLILCQKVEDLHAEIVTLRSLTDGIWPYSSRHNKISSWQKNRLSLLLKELGHNQCLPLLLSASRVLNQEEFYSLVQLLEVFFFRYKLICDGHAASFTSRYLAEAKRIRECNGQAYDINPFKDILKDLINRKADAQTFQRCIQNNVVYTDTRTNKTLKYLLITLDSYLNWFQNGQQGAPRPNDTMILSDFAAATIEHIYPKNARVEDREPSLENIKNNLGNLSYWGEVPNSVAENDMYNEKVEAYRQSPIRLNQELATLGQWTIDEYITRHADLIQMTLELFTIA